jgi:hypothetical protein
MLVHLVLVHQRDTISGWKPLHFGCHPNIGMTHPADLEFDQPTEGAKESAHKNSEHAKSFAFC